MSSDDETTSVTIGLYVVYKSRWLVLFSFCMLSMVNAWIWITWSPCVEVSTHLWRSGVVSESQMDALSGIYFYIYVPFSFLSLQLLKRKGLRFGLLVASTLNVVGAFIRWYAILARTYRTVYIGTIFCALAQTFTLSMPPMLSGHWFSDHERGIATAIGVLSNSVGTAVGLGASIFLKFPAIPTTKAPEFHPLVEDIVSLFRIYLFLQLIISVLASFSMYLFVKSDYPPTPPSRAAWEQQTHSRNTNDGGVETTISDGLVIARNTPNETSVLLSEIKQQSPCKENNNHPDYWDSIRMFLTDPSGLSFTVAYGLAVSCYYSVPPFLSQLLFHVVSFDNPDTSTTALGWLGILYIVGAILGSFVAGSSLDKASFTARTIFGILLLLSAFFVFCLSCLSSTDITTTATTALLTLATCIVTMTGFFLGSLITAGFEYGTAISYPADEAAVAGILECSAELFGFVQVTIGGDFSSYNKGTMNLHYTTMLVGCLLLSGTIFALSVRADSRRPSS
jgi:FLVCR family feline leukemia virus subgroup C receptor-related protein